MRITVTHGIDDLANDLAAIPVRAVTDMVRTVAENARTGRDVAKLFAQESAGKHGKHYHKAITVESLAPLIWEYGPDSSKKQGGMSFEWGSRKQKPHKDLAKSADVIGPEFHSDVRALPGRWFW